jgi:translation elongation factor EF-Tu-like GTPase
MSWFRRKTEVVDAEHLLQEAADVSPTNDPGAAAQVGAADLSRGGAAVDFKLTIADVFVIKNRGTVVTGQVDAGSVSVGSEVAVTRDGQVLRRVKVTGVEMFRKTVDTAVAGQNVGLLLDNVSREDVTAGDVLTG